MFCKVSYNHILRASDNAANDDKGRVKYDFSSVKHMSTAGEALNPEVYYQFEKLTD